MIHFLYKPFSLIICFSFAILAYPSISFSKIAPKNYNFSLDQLADFSPGKSLQEIKGKYGQGDLIFNDGKIETLKFYVTHIRYRFPVFVILFEKKSIAYYARLPSYFLHNLFHQSLINRFGKQDLYSKKDNAAVYVWKNKEGFRYTYQGQCTITCFPMYLQVESVALPQDLAKQASLLEKLFEKLY